MFVCLSLSHQTNGHWCLSNTLSTYTELHIYYTNGALSVVHIYENDIFTCQYTWGTFLHKFITCYNNLFTDFFVNPQFLPITEIDSNQISQIKPIFSSLKKNISKDNLLTNSLSFYLFTLLMSDITLEKPATGSVKICRSSFRTSSNLHFMTLWRFDERQISSLHYTWGGKFRGFPQQLSKSTKRNDLFLHHLI